MEEKKTLATTYDPKEFEDRLTKRWQDQAYFKGNRNPAGKPYTIIMPPPNITGKLHMGHALDNTLQDILIRYRRMQGDNALWLPGQDHASIATEVKVENELLKEGIHKKEIGREKFLEYTWQWANTYREKIRQQLDRLGCSCDYSRQAFTMDDHVSKAVRHTFVKLFNEGLIYRGQRITNWCPKCLTAISDAEMEYEEKNGHFWHISYPLADGSGALEIATTRPETMLGDTAVAVHPADDRFKAFVGKSIRLPFTDREIPIIADAYVDPEFGTGCVKITPAHDPNDYQVGLRHDLPQVNMMTQEGTIAQGYGKYSGLDRYEARKAIVADLKDQGLLVKTRDINHNVSTHDRCGTSIEPMISQQWYVAMEKLAQPAIEVVRDKTIRFIPERLEKTYYNWMENIQDWCISRQLWWGHQIPVWYCLDCDHIMASEDTPKSCPKCHSQRLKQDEDVLDTWFSSALWPFSTLGWPETTEDFKTFYPTSTLVTGYDIIFHWVARMIFSGLNYTGKIPFDTVLFHGIVRDESGRKMSKSLGNGVDPLDVIDRYGADALRYILVTGNAPGNDIRYKEDKVEAARNFANKIWNASRFAMMNLDGEIQQGPLHETDLALADRWILHRKNQVVKEVTHNLDRFEIGIAIAKTYDFLWTEFCDWYIELSKTTFTGQDEAAKAVSRAVLLEVLSDGLKLLHPVMPFITEEIYTHLTGEETITLAAWPQVRKELEFEAASQDMDYIIAAIKGIRNLRQEMYVPPSRKAKLYILPEEDAQAAFRAAGPYLEKLALASSVEIIKEKGDQENLVPVITPGGEIFLPLLDLIDKETELKRLKKEIEKYQGEVARLEKKLSNEKFLAKAPADVIDQEKDKLDQYQRLLEQAEKSYGETEAL